MAESPILKLLGKKVHGGLMAQLDERMEHLRKFLADLAPDMYERFVPETGSPSMQPEI